MTLCIGWKTNNQISFASDSRISQADDQYIDLGIKVMEIPVQIMAPTDFDTGITETIYDYKVGLCFCGSVLNAYLIKETVEIVLQKLQCLPSHTDYSLYGICKFISKFLSETTNQFFTGLGIDATVEFLIGGYCPKFNKIMVYHLKLIKPTNLFEITINEVIADDNDYILMGSGKVSAEHIIKNLNIQDKIPFLKVLREVCNDDAEPSVGGYLQYGKFEGKNFNLKGIIDYRIRNDGRLEQLMTYRGTFLYNTDAIAIPKDSFHIFADFLHPFEDDINSYYQNLADNI